MRRWSGVVVMGLVLMMAVHSQAVNRAHLRQGVVELDEPADTKPEALEATEQPLAHVAEDAEDSSNDIPKEDGGASEIEEEGDEERHAPPEELEKVPKDSDATAEKASEDNASRELRACKKADYRNTFILEFRTISVCEDAKLEEACAQVGKSLEKSCSHDAELCAAFAKEWCEAHKVEGPANSSGERTSDEEQGDDGGRCGKAIIVQFLLASTPNPCTLSSDGDAADRLIAGVVESRNCPGKSAVIRNAIAEAYEKGCKQPEVEADGKKMKGGAFVLDCSNIQTLAKYFMDMEPDSLCASSNEELCQAPALALCEEKLCIEKAEVARRTRQCSTCQKDKAIEYLLSLDNLCDRRPDTVCMGTNMLAKFDCIESACEKLLDTIQEKKQCAHKCNVEGLREKLSMLKEKVCLKTAEEHCKDDLNLSGMHCDAETCTSVAADVLASTDCKGQCDFVALAQWWEVKEGMCKKSAKEHCEEKAVEIEGMHCSHKECENTVQSVLEEKKCPGTDMDILTSTSGVEKKEKKVAEKVIPPTHPEKLITECDEESLRKKASGMPELCNADIADLLSTLSLDFNCKEDRTLVLINGMREQHCVAGKLVSENTCDLDGLIKSLKTKNALCEDDAPKLICGRVNKKFNCNMEDCVGAISAERMVSCKTGSVAVHVLQETEPVVDVDEELRGNACDSKALFESIAVMTGRCEPEMATYCKRDGANLMGCTVEVCRTVLSNIRAIDCPEQESAAKEAKKSDSGITVHDIEEEMIVPDGKKEEEVTGDDAARKESDSDVVEHITLANPEQAKPEQASGGDIASLRLECGTMKLADYGEHADVLCKAHKEAKVTGEGDVRKTCQKICANAEKIGECITGLESVYANCSNE